MRISSSVTFSFLSSGRMPSKRKIKLVERLKTTPEYENVLEEVADVQIMLNQIVYLLDMDTTEMVDFKLQRQIERIGWECSN